MTISQELIDILACPQCKGDVTLTESGEGLCCPSCKLIYEIRDGIPVMLAEEAKPMD
ncbi:MAG: Trm112 family protein [Desulfobacterales bacterium]|nr:Trm112 family protein [Desulfobacterales bacterium]